jgi:hypothetical protein
MLREIKMDERTRWLIGYVLQYVILVLAFVLCVIVAYRAGGVRAAQRYEEWQVRFVDDYMAQQEAARNGMPPDPKVQLREQQAQALAKVLYGVKDNSEQDLRTMCWCVFNRVDSPDYPDTLEEVIDQPQQWMRYDPENPVIDNLYKIAEQELVAWQDGKTRPITSDFVYMNWTPNQIKLRNAWKDGSTTDYWRYGQ